MSNFFLILNLKRQQNGPTVITSTGLKEMESSKSLEGTFRVIGECDAYGNLLSAIADSNFMSAPVKKVAVPEKSKPSIPKKAVVPDMDDDGPLMQDFSEEDKKKLKAIKDETRRQAESGIAAERSAAGKLEEKDGSKAGPGKGKPGTGTGKTGASKRKPAGAAK